MNDPDLREPFAHLRASEQQNAPAFQRQWQRAVNRSRSPRPARHRLAWSLAVIALICIAAPILKPKPSLTKVLPVLLNAEAQTEPLFAQLDTTGSDYLLPLNLTMTSF